jgi:hypothetical protein
LPIIRSACRSWFTTAPIILAVLFAYFIRTERFWRAARLPLSTGRRGSTNRLSGG